MNLTFVDWSEDVVDALRQAFLLHPEVAVLHSPIFDVAQDTLVSPANSFGHMDGGIDKVYVDFFGDDLQRRVYDAIERRSQGKLPVGSALIVETNHETIPRLIVAPTMELPGPIRAPNVYFAMAACLSVASRLPASAQVFSPGFGTGVGDLDPQEAAREMASAYAKWQSRGRGDDGHTNSA